MHRAVHWRPRDVLLPSAMALLLVSGAKTFVDPDVWHSMALARETLAVGRLPLEDRFAYTPTVHPVVHHEWGTGMILYALATTGGVIAFQVVRLALLGATGGGAVAVARLRGATTASLLAMAPVAIVMSWIGLTAIRAQVFTLAFLALWLFLIEIDRRGSRWWIPVALLAQVVWQNLHAGFVVGLGFLALHGLEQAARRRPWAHVFGTIAAGAVLTAASPYGPSYPGYLLDALSMPRPLISEWRPLWEAHPVGLGVYLVSVALALAAFGRGGAFGTPGWPILAIAMLLALRHERHVSIYALVWLAYVPAMLGRTAAGAALDALWRRPAPIVGQAAALVVVAAAVATFVGQRPWELVVPATPGRGAPAPYPVGAVEYLARHQVRGNVMVPFVVGAYVSWKLHPAVRVSIDSRYEAAYAPGLLEEHHEVFDARAGWGAVLGRYPTDLLLARRTARIVGALATHDGWTRVYDDSEYVLFARAGMRLPYENRRRPELGTLP